MRLVHRILKLEEKRQQPQSQVCFPLSYFYGQPANPEPLIPGQTLSDFYASLPARTHTHGN